MDLPRITVVTPSFNQGQYLEATIRSVLDQGYPKLEYMVVDGGSSDDSVEIIRRHEGRLAWWISEKDQGQSNAINKGFARGTGELFSYINSDDTLIPGSLAAAAESYQNGHQWITGWALFLEPQEGQWPQLPRAMATNIDWFRSNPICQQGTFWAARFTRELGGFWEDMRYTFDYEFWMRLWFVAKVKPLMLRRCMGGFRLHETSKTVSEQEAFWPEFRRVRAHYRPRLTPQEQRAWDEAVRHEEWQNNHNWAWQSLTQGDVAAARKYAKEALRRNRTSLHAWKLMYCAMRGY